STLALSTLSLHDALPILHLKGRGLDGDVTTIERAIARWIRVRLARRAIRNRQIGTRSALWLERRTAPRDSVSALVKSMEPFGVRSEEHTSELQSLAYLVC